MDDTVQELLELWKELTPAQQHAVLEFIRGFIDVVRM